MNQLLTPEIERRLATTATRVTRGGKRLVLRRNGRIVGAIIGKRDLDRLQAIAEDEQDAKESLSRLATEVPVPYEQVRVALGLK
jgi:hypothetical protein